MIMIFKKNFILALVLFLCLVASVVEAVCQNEVSLLMTKDGLSDQQSQRRGLRYRRELQDVATAPAIQIIQQRGDTVQFVVQNTTMYGDDDRYSFVPDHLFLSYETDEYGSQHCYHFKELGPINDEISFSDVQTAHCRSHSDTAIVRLYVRSFRLDGVTTTSATVPNCCDDPYANELSSFESVEYIYEIQCLASCTESPTNFPTFVMTDVPTIFPTQFPTQFPTAL